MRSDRLSRETTLTDYRTSRTSSADNGLAPSTLTSCAETPVESLNIDQKDSFREPEIQALEKSILKLNKPIPPPPPENRNPPSKTSHLPTPAEKDSHPHWSTSRESNRQYTTCDGFRRQENEREMHYVFMPEGPVEDLPNGHRCALCHLANPNEDHLRYHNVWHFAKTSKAPLRRSRKGEFEKLLRAHHVPDTHVDHLVSKWRIVQKKKAYSCGLCITLIPSLSKRTSHMCRDHFGQGQNLDNWDDNNLIKGLLLQPELRKCCRVLFKSDPSRADSTFVWPSSVVKDLQYKLELGQSTPQELALLAFKAAENTGEASSNQDVAATGSQFPLQTFHITTAPAVMVPDGVPGTLPATRGIPFPFPTSPATPSDMQKDPMLEEDRLDDTYDLLHTQQMPDTNTKHQTRTNSPVLHPIEQIGFHHYSPEALSQAPVTLMDFINNHSHAGAMAVEEHGMYIPPHFSTSTFMSVDAMPALDPSLSHDPPAWFVQDQDSSPRYDTNDQYLAAPVPKRKLSENSTVAAHSRPQTMSPMDLRPGIPRTLETIQKF